MNTIIIAPPCSGKTHLARRGLLHDGDDIIATTVGWPKVAKGTRWWLTPASASYQYTHCSAIRSYLDGLSDETVAFSCDPAVMADVMQQQAAELVVWLPPLEEHAYNTWSRQLNPNGHSYCPSLLDTLRSRNNLREFALNHESTFTLIELPGAALAKRLMDAAAAKTPAQRTRVTGTLHRK